MGRGRITIGLYNSYDQNFREPHRRVIARAGDLARAYDMGLALFGFPIPENARTPKEIAEWVAGTTSIGGHGKNFMEMAESGRFQCFPYPGKGFPPQLGEIVLTTCKPDAKKQITLSETVDMVSRGQSITLLFGIGPHGVPKNVMSIPKYNLDITPGGFSLETCTALGAVCGALYARLWRRSSRQLLIAAIQDLLLAFTEHGAVELLLDVGELRHALYHLADPRYIDSRIHGTVLVC